MEHDARRVCCRRWPCDWLWAERIVRPPVDALTRRVAAARDAPGSRPTTASGRSSLRRGHASLDGLLDVDPDLGITRLAWLRRGATAATPEVLKAELDKLEFLRRHGADRLDLSCVPAGRRRMLAETYVEVLDELVQLFDQALAGRRLSRPS